MLVHALQFLAGIVVLPIGSGGGGGGGLLLLLPLLKGVLPGPALLGVDVVVELGVAEVVGN